jgi:hypothetical protein
MEFNLKVPNIFGYEPELVPGIVFSVLFFGSLVTHCWQTYHYRKWWLIVFILGAFGELAGWAARTAAHKCSYSVQAFQAQLSSLIMGKSRLRDSFCLLSGREDAGESLKEIETTY